VQLSVANYMAASASSPSAPVRRFKRRPAASSAPWSAAAQSRARRGAAEAARARGRTGDAVLKARGACRARHGCRGKAAGGGLGSWPWRPLA
jgi:hypothetical protein